MSLLSREKQVNAGGRYIAGDMLVARNYLPSWRGGDYVHPPAAYSPAVAASDRPSLMIARVPSANEARLKRSSELHGYCLRSVLKRKQKKLGRQ